MKIMRTQKTISRRDFLKIIAVGGAAGLAVKLGADQLIPAEAITETRILMGTIVNLTVVGDDPDSIRGAIRACLDRMSALEAVFSRFQLESQLSQLNRTGFLENADPSLLEVVRESQRFSQLSGGAFDITVKPLLDLYQQGKTQGTGLPSENEVCNALEKVGFDKIKISGQDIGFSTEGMRITVDGIAKGYIVDQGIAVLRKNGFQNVLVEAGGDLMALGKKSTAKSWQVGIQSPRRALADFLTRIPLQNQAVATSGDYMQAYSPDFRYHHIIDPRTGFSAHELASATVVAPSVMQADGLATTAMVMRPTATLSLIDGLKGCDAFLVTKDIEILKTGGLVNV
jgi:thiamine biosynthesis lipoprotein